MKICSNPKCLQPEKPLSKFDKDKSRKDGLTLECKPCKSIKAKKFYLKNKEKINKRTKNYRDKHKEYYKKYRKQYYIDNKKEMLKKAKIWWKNNKQKIKNWRYKNKEKIREK